MKILRYFVNTLKPCTCLKVLEVFFQSECHRTFVPNLMNFLLSFVMCIALKEAVVVMVRPHNSRSKI